jgi:endoglycosylceramidase
VDGTRLFDATGRQLLLRGINAGGRSKTPPYAPFPFAESGRDEQRGSATFETAAAEYFDRLAAWGLSVVRLPFSWEALEPTRCSYDETYLQRVLTMARACGERGMRVIVDFHQDVFARPYAGDGFPLWACPQPVGEPSGPVHTWFMGYVQDETMKLAFDRFWRNEDGLRDSFEAMWRHLAARAWTIDAVIGFEVINEPGWGTANMHDWARQTLTPFYSHMASVLHDVAPGSLIFFDSTGADSLTCTTGLQRPDGDNLVFAPHFYAPEVIMEGRWDGNLGATGPLRNWAKLGAKWDLPVLLGEFGITTRADGCEAYVRANYDRLDELLLHGTLWECSTTVDDWNDEGMSVLGPGGSEGPTVKELVRPYPLAVAGELTSFSWKDHRLEVKYRAVAGGVSEVVAPARCFAGGIAIELHGVPGEVTQRGDRVVVRADEAGDARLCVAMK